MIYLPFARDRRLWLPSPYLRGRSLLPSSSITLLGSGFASAANATVVITTTVATNPGDLLIGAVYVAQHTITAPVPTIANSGTAETWATDKQQRDGSVDPNVASIFRSESVAAHAIGTTFSFDTVNGVYDNMLACVFKVSPEQLGTPVTLNASSGAAGSSTAAAPGSATPTRNPTLGVLAIGAPVSFSAVPGGGWTQRYNFSGTLTTATLYVGTLAKQDQVGVNNGATLSSTGAWVAAQALYPMSIQNRLSQQQNAQNAMNRGSW